MSTNILMSIVIGIVLFFLIIKFAKSLLRILLIMILIVGVGLYGYLHFYKINSISDLNAKYCKVDSDKKDSLKCVCIVKPLEEDLNSRFSKEDLINMGSFEFAKELSIAFFNKRNEISQKLKEHEAESLLDEFTKESIK